MESLPADLKGAMPHIGKDQTDQPARMLHWCASGPVRTELSQEYTDRGTMCLERYVQTTVRPLMSQMHTKHWTCQFELVHKRTLSLYIMAELFRYTPTDRSADGLEEHEIKAAIWSVLPDCSVWAYNTDDYLERSAYTPQRICGPYTHPLRVFPHLDKVCATNFQHKIINSINTQLDGYGSTTITVVVDSVGKTGKTTVSHMLQNRLYNVINVQLLPESKIHEITASIADQIQKNTGYKWKGVILVEFSRMADVQEYIRGLQLLEICKNRILVCSNGHIIYLHASPACVLFTRTPLSDTITRMNCYNTITATARDRIDETN